MSPLSSSYSPHAIPQQFHNTSHNHPPSQPKSHPHPSSHPHLPYQFPPQRHSHSHSQLYPPHPPPGDGRGLDRRHFDFESRPRDSQHYQKAGAVSPEGAFGPSNGRDSVKRVPENGRGDQGKEMQPREERRSSINMGRTESVGSGKSGSNSNRGMDLDSGSRPSSRAMMTSASGSGANYPPEVDHALLPSLPPPPPSMFGRPASRPSSGGPGRGGLPPPPLQQPDPQYQHQHPYPPPPPLNHQPPLQGRPSSQGHQQQQRPPLGPYPYPQQIRSPPVNHTSEVMNSPPTTAYPTRHAHPPPPPPNHAPPSPIHSHPQPPSRHHLPFQTPDSSPIDASVFPSSASFSHRGRTYLLDVRQQPVHSRMCGSGEKADRRPIDPPPIVRLKIGGGATGMGSNNEGKGLIGFEYLGMKSDTIGDDGTANGEEADEETGRGRIRGRARGRGRGKGSGRGGRGRGVKTRNMGMEIDEDEENEAGEEEDQDYDDGENEDGEDDDDEESSRRSNGVASSRNLRSRTSGRGKGKGNKGKGREKNGDDLDVQAALRNQNHNGLDTSSRSSPMRTDGAVGSTSAGHPVSGSHIAAFGHPPPPRSSSSQQLHPDFEDSQILTANTITTTGIQSPFYFMFATLVSADDATELKTMANTRTRFVTGSVVSSLYYLKDPTDGTWASFFVFPDIGVRTEGTYRFKMSMYEVVSMQVYFCAAVYTDNFSVYSAKKFPGMNESTEISKSFANQGIRLRVRRPIKMRNRRKQADDEDDDHEEEEDRSRDWNPPPPSQPMTIDNGQPSPLSRRPDPYAIPDAPHPSSQFPSAPSPDLSGFPPTFQPTQHPFPSPNTTKTRKGRGSAQGAGKGRGKKAGEGGGGTWKRTWREERELEELERRQRLEAGEDLTPPPETKGRKKRKVAQRDSPEDPSQHPTGYGSLPPGPYDDHFQWNRSAGGSPLPPPPHGPGPAQYAYPPPPWQSNERGPPYPPPDFHYPPHPGSPHQQRPYPWERPPSQGRPYPPYEYPDPARHPSQPPAHPNRPPPEFDPRYPQNGFPPREGSREWPGERPPSSRERQPSQQSLLDPLLRHPSAGVAPEPPLDPRLVEKGAPPPLPLNPQSGHAPYPRATQEHGPLSNGAYPPRGGPPEEDGKPPSDKGPSFNRERHPQERHDGRAWHEQQRWAGYPSQPNGEQFGPPSHSDPRHPQDPSYNQYPARPGEPHRYPREYGWPSYPGESPQAPPNIPPPPPGDYPQRHPPPGPYMHPHEIPPQSHGTNRPPPHQAPPPVDPSITATTPPLAERGCGAPPPTSA